MVVYNKFYHEQGDTYADKIAERFLSSVELK
jgi:hypothetical protein